MRFCGRRLDRCWGRGSPHRRVRRQRGGRSLTIGVDLGGERAHQVGVVDGRGNALDIQAGSAEHLQHFLVGHPSISSDLVNPSFPHKSPIPFVSLPRLGGADSLSYTSLIHRDGCPECPLKGLPMQRPVQTGLSTAKIRPSAPQSSPGHHDLHRAAPVRALPFLHAQADKVTLRLPTAAAYALPLRTGRRQGPDAAASRSIDFRATPRWGIASRHQSERGNAHLRPSSRSRPAGTPYRLHSSRSRT